VAVTTGTGLEELELEFEEVGSAEVFEQAAKKTAQAVNEINLRIPLA
jgi:hypothetical protein